jgi:type IV secretory pathway VirB10-like protein
LSAAGERGTPPPPPPRPASPAATTANAPITGPADEARRLGAYIDAAIKAKAELHEAMDTAKRWDDEVERLAAAQAAAIKARDEARKKEQQAVEKARDFQGGN